MDPAAKKRKPDENGSSFALLEDLTEDDCRKIVDSFSVDQLRDIVAAAMRRDDGVLSAVRAVADPDQTKRKLFIRGLGWETTTESLRSIFSAYGDLEEAVVIVDKNTGKSKGYGFITFRHIDGAVLALKNPSKQIDGRMTVCQLAAAGNSGPAAASAVDVSLRKIYVGNVPADMPSDRLLHHFSAYGEIEEGPLGFDKQTGKFRGFALFVYKTAGATTACLMEPNKTIDGYSLVCKLATEGKKGKPSVGGPQGQLMAGVADAGRDGLGYGHQSSLPGPMSNQYGGPGSGMDSYGSFSGSGIQGAGAVSMNSSLSSSMAGGTPGLSSGSQGPAAPGGTGTGAYGGFCGPYNSSSQYSGSGAGGYGGYGIGSYHVPPTSGGMPSGGFPDSSHYSLSSSSYLGQHHQPVGSSPGPRVPSGGMYQNVPPYY